MVTRAALLVQLHQLEHTLPQPNRLVFRIVVLVPIRLRQEPLQVQPVSLVQLVLHLMPPVQLRVQHVSPVWLISGVQQLRQHVLHVVLEGKFV